MACLKIGLLVLACFVFIDAQVIPVRCPKKCGKVRKLVNNVPECACGKLEPIYSIIGEVPKCGCGKVYVEPAKDICGCKVPSIDSQIVGLLDYITGIVETKCGCQVTPCGCQVTPCGCQVTPCGCQVTPCGCQVTPCGCQVTPCGCQATPCGCQQSVRIPNAYDILPAIDIPRGTIVKVAYTTPAIEACGKCSQIDCNCRTLPYEVITPTGCVQPVLDVPRYVYSLQAPLLDLMPLDCGCRVGNCGCGVANSGCGLAKVEPCSCGVVNCECVGPCICGTGAYGCGIPNCGCLNVCGCGIPDCNCVSPCTCGVTAPICGCVGCCDCVGSCGCVGSCSCVGPCGCVNTECGYRKRSRKSSIPPPFL